MAFNGSGTYALPSADLPVTGQLISSTKMNNVLTDLATALTNTVCKDGQSTMSGALKMGSQKITGLADGTAGAPAIAFANSTTAGFYSSGTNKVALAVDGTKIVEWDSTGLIGEVGAATIGGFSVGYKRVPASATTSGAIAAADSGKHIAAIGGVTIPDATFSQGDAVTIYNTTSGAITITASITTLRLAGTTLTGNRTLGAYGLATILFQSGTLGVISGAGLT